MMKKALILTLAMLVLLLAGCGTLPAEEKESAKQTQTVSFPAGNDTEIEAEQAEEPVETTEQQDKKTNEAVAETVQPKAEETPQTTGRSEEEKAPQSEPPKSEQPKSETPKAGQQPTEQKPTTPPTEKPAQGGTETQPPKESEPEPTTPPEPAKPKSIYDYEFDIAAIKQELLAIGTGMGLEVDNSLTPDSSSWGNPVTASKDFQGASLERSLKDYVRSMSDIITAYGGEPIHYFTIYVESLGGGSYRIYFLY